jgi:acetyl esterase/lipase
MVVCPGGGYGGLASDHEWKQVAEFYNSLGISAFVLFYRLGSQGYHHPTELNDAKRALRWVRANAGKYQIDPHRIGITGFSAGGHLASTAGTLFDDGDANASDPIDHESSRPDIMVLGYPVITMMSDYTHRGSRNNLLGPEKDSDELAAKLSSEKNVTDRTPPTFLFQTDEDTVVPSENAVNFYLALHKHHVPAEMHLYQRGPHGVGLLQGDPVLGTWRHHLADWLRNNAFLSAAPRAAVEGTVTVNGKPVSWGSIAFYPKDEHQPLASTRLMHGAFKLDAKSGPPVGTHHVQIWFSASDVPSLTTKEAPEGVMHVEKLSASDPQPLTVEIKEGMNKLSYDVKYP